MSSHETPVSNRKRPLLRSVPKPAPWLRSIDTDDEGGANDRNVADLHDQIESMQTTMAEQETTIVFLRDLLTERWFDGVA
jgi:hypothetical protein